VVAGHPILPKRTAKNAVLFMFNPFGIKIVSRVTIYLSLTGLNMNNNPEKG